MQLEGDILPVLARMEYAGVALDKEKLTDI